MAGSGLFRQSKRCPHHGLLDAAAANALGANLSADGRSAFLNADFLQVRLELAAADACRFPPVAAQIFRLPALFDPIAHPRGFSTNVTSLAHRPHPTQKRNSFAGFRETCSIDAVLLNASLRPLLRSYRNPGLIVIVGVITQWVRNPNADRPRPSSPPFLLSDLFFQKRSRLGVFLSKGELNVNGCQGVDLSIHPRLADTDGNDQTDVDDEIASGTGEMGGFWQGMAQQLAPDHGETAGNRSCP
jgi:hypothetical protein